MSTLIWCAIGLAAGGLAAVGRGQDMVRRIETLAVGMFGAVIGGDFMAAMLAGGKDEQALRASSVLLAVVGAAVMLGLLALTRRSVGPLKPHRLRRR